jgi:hypothetical protein
LTTRLLSVRPASSLGVLLRRAFDQHALHAADHGLADGLRLFVDALLQAQQPFELDSCGVSSARSAAGVPGRAL